MPTTDEVTAHWRIYQDAAHTILHPCHYDTLMDVYKRDFNADKLDQIISEGRPGVELEGFIESQGELVGLIEDNGLSLVGEIQNDAELVGFILEEDMLVGVLESPDAEIVGFIEC